VGKTIERRRKSDQVFAGRNGVDPPSEYLEKIGIKSVAEK